MVCDGEVLMYLGVKSFQTASDQTQKMGGGETLHTECEWVFGGGRVRPLAFSQQPPSRYECGMNECWFHWNPPCLSRKEIYEINQLLYEIDQLLLLK